MGGRGGRVAVFTTALISIGIVTGVAASAVAPAARTHLAEAPLLLAVLALASHLIIRVQVRGEAQAFDLFEAVLAPTIVVLAGPVAVAVAAGAKGIAGIVHRNEPVKAWFNVGQWAAATGCGATVFALVRDGGSDLDGRTLAALVAAMVTVALVNYVSFITVVTLATGRSVATVVAELRSSMAVAWFGGTGVNVAFGVLFVSAYLHSPAAVVVMVVPLAVLHWGGRGFAAARTDQVRLAGLQSATHALADPIDPRDALPRFLAEVRDCFEADAAELVEVSGARHLAGEVSDGTPTMQTMVRKGDRMFGVLRVYNRGGAEGFEQGEAAVLDALAGEVAGALEKAELLEGILEERRQLADIVGNTSDGILTLDERGRVTSWNAGLEAITGHPAVNMVGQVCDDVLVPRDADGKPIAWAAWSDADVELPVAVEVVTADHQSRWLSCSYTAVPARDDRGPQLVLMARDVTKARELDKLKDDFVAVVSHELRTPLAPIKGWAVTLLRRGDDLPPDQRREGARAILRQADRLEQLIMNILEDSRVELDVNTTTVNEAVDACASVRKIVEDFTLLAPEREITLRGDDLPALVAGRTVRIEQILANLVANAVKYSPKHEPIEVTVERGLGTLLVSVTDHGPGIPPEARERVFQRFERLAETPTQTGTGLGLYIARRLAQSMGADLGLTAATGGGSTFTLRLKTAPVAVPEATAV